MVAFDVDFGTRFVTKQIYVIRDNSGIKSYSTSVRFNE